MERKATQAARRAAFDYASRLCARLPRRLQDVREARTRSKYGLGRDSGVAREMIGRIESGRTVPTLFVVARLAFTLGMTLTEFVQGLDGGALA